MKKKTMVLGGLIAAVAITGASVAGTYAKYTSTFTGSTSTATVAKWAFKINDTAVTNSFDFDLFDTITVTEVDGTTAEAHVATGKIAPGTGGKFDIKLANDSEVDAEYTIAYTVTNGANIPVEFSIDGGANWTKGLNNTTAISINRGANETITIQWRWAFEGTDSANYTDSQTDATDTALGEATTAPTLSVKADITVTQVD